MARPEFWHLSYVVFPALILLHICISPWTKVEESFNIQATHDIIKYGVPTDNVNFKLKTQYDHMTFAGAVPRTFIGALILAAAAKPLIWFNSLSGEQQQILGRS
jgi:alpha-1,6-mannosyltransferase